MIMIFVLRIKSRQKGYNVPNFRSNTIFILICQPYIVEKKQVLLYKNCPYFPSDPPMNTKTLEKDRNKLVLDF